MEEPNSDPEKTHGPDSTATNPRAPVIGKSEGNHEAQTEAGQHYAYESEDEVERTLRLFWDFVKQTFREAKPGERLAAWLTIILIACTVGVGIIYWLQLRQMVAATEQSTRSATTAASQLELAERPWVKADVAVNSGLTFDGSGAQIEFLNTLKNIGSTPAINVLESQEIYLSSPARRNVKEERDRFCSQFKPTRIGHTIFPQGDKFEETVLLHIPQSDIVAVQADYRKAYGVTAAFLSASLISCIPYNSTFNADSKYFTTTVHEIFRAPSLAVGIGENVRFPALMPNPIVGVQAQ